jgi:hypothetical protein
MGYIRRNLRGWITSCWWFYFPTFPFTSKFIIQQGRWL